MICKAYFNFLEFWVEILFKKYDLSDKFLINLQTVYLEQTFTGLLNLVGNHYWQYYTTSVISRCSTFSPLLSLVILFSVLPSNFIVSGVKHSRLYPFLILYVILFQFYLHISVLMVCQYFLHVFLKQSWISDTEYDPSGAEIWTGVEVGADILNLLLFYGLFMFFCV